MGQIAILAYIAIGGAVGACSRYLISDLMVSLLGKGFPYGTLLVNILGSFIMGLLMAAIATGMIQEQPWRQIIGLGFLGALTTFSTFSMDNVSMLQQGEFVKMGVYILSNVILSITVAWVGFQILNKG